MDMVEIVVKVPREYVEDAGDFGMLDPNTLARILQEELNERIIKFVDTEVKAYRAEKRTQDKPN